MEFNSSEFNEFELNEAETMGITYTLTLSETITGSDEETNVPNKVLPDTLLMFDGLHSKVIGKGCEATIRLADWLTVKRSTRQNGWFD